MKNSIRVELLRHLRDAITDRELQDFDELHHVAFNEDYYIMLPELDMGRDYSHLSSKPKVLFDSFSSSDDVQSQEYLTRLLNNGGFLV